MPACSLRSTSIATVLGLIGNALAGQAPPVPIGDFRPFVDSLLDAERLRAASPGAVLVAVLNGRVLHAAGSGYANLEERIPVDPARTVFRVGSVSKTLTALVAMQLVERGALQLDRDVNDYLTSVRVPARFGEPITLFHLLTHTAGFEERLFGQHAPNFERWQPLDRFLGERLTERVLPPGRMIAYNDFGTALAGLVVEQAAGTSFAKVTRDRVFAPLAMHHTSFRVESLPPHIADNLATAYRRIDDRYVPYAYDYIMTPPAAGLVSTASDMARLLIAMLGDGTRATGVLAPETVLRIRSPAFRNHPLLRGRALGYVMDRENGLHLLAKDGQATGFTARLVLAPTRDFGLFTAQNRSILEPGGHFNLAASFTDRVTSAVLDRLFPPDPDGPPLTPPEPIQAEPPLSAFAGTYRNVVGSWTGLETLATLFDEVVVRANGNGTLAVGFGEWVRVGPDAFQWHEGVDAYRAFRIDDNGRPTHLFINAGTYRRVSWYQTSRFTVAAAVLAVLVGVMALLAAAVARLRRGTVNPPPTESHPMRVWRVLVLIGAGVYVAFTLTFGIAFGSIDPQRLFQGIPPTIAATLLLPLLHAALVMGAVAAGIWSVIRRDGTWQTRTWYAAVTGAMALAVVVLDQWNLIGFKY